MALSLQIAGIDRTAWLGNGSLHVSRSINGMRASLDCRLEDQGRGYTPDVGNIITVLDGGTKRFSGNIRSRRIGYYPYTSIKYYILRALDFNALPDRHRVQVDYPAGMSLQEIVLGIVAFQLTADGVTTSNVPTGPTIAEPFRLNFNSVREGFDKLSQITGKYGDPYLWYIDFDKDLHFSQFAAVNAPFSLSDTSGNWFDLEVEKSIDNYRNNQYVRSEFAVDAPFTESFTGDGSTTAFITSAVIVSTPTVFVNGVQGTVGELGVDNTGKDWYWIRDGFGIFNQDHAVLTSSDTLDVVYVSQAANVVNVYDSTQMGIMATAFGDSGEFAAVDEQKNISSVATMRAIATGDLALWGTMPNKPTYGTYAPGLEPGQVQHITNTVLGLSGDYFIEQVDFNWRAGGDRSPFLGNYLEYRIQASDVKQFGSRTWWWEKLVEMARIGSDPSTITGELPEPPQGCPGWGETPTGTMDGSNTSFTLANAPNPPQALILAINGVVLRQGTDYTLAGNIISYTAAPSSTDWHRAWYSFGFAQNSEIPTLTSSSPFISTGYTLAQSPVPVLSLLLFVNGILQLQGTDYTLSGAQITFTTGPDYPTDWLRAWYAIADTGVITYGETPSGTINGTNKAFTLAATPSCVLLVLNGVIQGEGLQFTMSGSTINYLSAPSSGDWHRAWYKL